MQNDVKETGRGISIRDLFYVLKRNILLLLAVIFVFTIGGVLFANAQSPVYTARELVFFRAKSTETSSNSDVINISLMRAYVQTVTDFADEGVVIDRANYYYEEYKKSEFNGNVDTYIAKVVEVVVVDDKTGETAPKPGADTYDGQITANKYYSKSSIGISTGAKADDGSAPFSFTVSYTDKTKTTSYEKVKILVLALRQECIEIDGADKKYFPGVDVEIIDDGPQGSPAINLSKNKTIMKFVVSGIVVAIVAVFLRNLLDNTVKTKEELERIVGVDVLSIIYTQGGK